MTCYIYKSTYTLLYYIQEWCNMDVYSLYRAARGVVNNSTDINGHQQTLH